MASTKNDYDPPNPQSAFKLISLTLIRVVLCTGQQDVTEKTMTKTFTSFW